MAARAIYKASLRLNELEVPVKLYAAVEDRSLRFRLLHEPDRQPVVQQLIDKTSDEPVERDTVRKAYSTDENQLVLLQPEELASLEPTPSREISVACFVEPQTLDYALYERPYYLGPDGDAAGYFALCQALARRQLEGIARWVMRKRTYVGALRVHDGYLMLITLRPVNELAEVASIGRAANKELSPQEIQLARQLIETLQGPFEGSAFEDDYRKKVEELVKAKASGKVVQLPRPKKASATSDLASALKSSLKTANKKATSKKTA